MKKLFIFILTSLFCVGLFADITTIPKNTKTLSDDYALRYYDDKLENNYELLSIVWKTDSSQIIGLKTRKKSLITNVETVLTFYFKTEEELDDFIENVIYHPGFSAKEIPDIFDDFKNWMIELGVEPLYVEGENHNPSQILYRTTLTK